MKVVLEIGTYFLIFRIALTSGLSCNVNGSSKTLTSKTRRFILDQHNEYRSLIAKGNATTNNGTEIMASAKNMYKLGYDCNLEVVAQGWADGCRGLVHSEDWYRRAGENLFIIFGKGFRMNLKKALAWALQAWFQELDNLGMNANDTTFTRELYGTGIGHFTQLAWGRTTHVGCGVAFCEQNETMLISCNYREKGNYFNEPVWEIGPPCQEDRECTTFANSTCDASMGLCEVPSDFRPKLPPLRKTTTTTPPTTSELVPLTDAEATHTPEEISTTEELSNESTTEELSEDTTIATDMLATTEHLTSTTTEMLETTTEETSSESTTVEAATIPSTIDNSNDTRDVLLSSLETNETLVSMSSNHSESTTEESTTQELHSTSPEESHEKMDILKFDKPKEQFKKSLQNDDTKETSKLENSKEVIDLPNPFKLNSTFTPNNEPDEAQQFFDEDQSVPNNVIVEPKFSDIVERPSRFFRNGFLDGRVPNFSPPTIFDDGVIKIFMYIFVMYAMYFIH